MSDTATIKLHLHQAARLAEALRAQATELADHLENCNSAECARTAVHAAHGSANLIACYLADASEELTGGTR